MQRSIYILSLMLMLMSMPVYGQKAKITDEGNKWIFYASWQHNQASGFGGFFMGDTVSKDGKLYRALHRGIDGNHKIDALLRDDTVENKVYAINVGSAYTISGDTNEFVLYDYNLVKGDTFKIVKKDTAKNVVLYVYKIDTFYINGLPHKHFHMAPASYYAQHMSIIEGMGCTTQPMFPYIGSFFEYGSMILCFKWKGTYHSIQEPPMYWFKNSKDCNDSFLHLGPLKLNAKQLKVYPVPATDKVKVEYGSHIGNGTAIMLNTVGRIVWQRELKNARETEIINNSYPAGVYYLKVTDNESGYIYCTSIVFQ